MFLRAVAGGLVVPMLVALLVLTTPMGTGQGVHSAQLLQPILPHVHLVQGRIVSHEQMALGASVQSVGPAKNAPVTGPAVGAGSGADPVSAGLGIGPAVPMLAWVLDALPARRLRAVEGDAPKEFLAAPSDPPPNFFA